MFWTKTKDNRQTITVPEQAIKRANQALRLGIPAVWVEQTLFLIGQNVTHHRKGDPLLEEAIQAAEIMLALLTRMREQEEESG